MSSYYFVLGREKQINQKELFAVLAGFDFGFSLANVSILSDDVLEIKLQASTEKVANLINILGGTVKIFQKIASKEEKISALLHQEKIKKKITFGLSNYTSSRIDTFKLALEAKRSFGQPLRVINGKDRGRLSSAQSFQYKMSGENLEYGFFPTGIGKLIAVQNVDDWSRRDYEKPASDARSGMLPPKLARAMVNLAVSNSKVRKPLVVDPFCGSGNLLLEALLGGYDVFGSDISRKAILACGKNINWLKANYVIKASYKLQLIDARKLNFAAFGTDFVVVTEPYLGQPRQEKLSIAEAEQTTVELRKLYQDFLKNLKRTVDPNHFQCLLLVFPLFELDNGKRLSLYQNCVDSLKEIGYITICPPLVYGRDYQVVKRELVILN